MEIIIIHTRLSSSSAAAADDADDDEADSAGVSPLAPLTSLSQPQPRIYSVSISLTHPVFFCSYTGTAFVLVGSLLLLSSRRLVFNNKFHTATHISSPLLRGRASSQASTTTVADAFYKSSPVWERKKRRHNASY